MKEPRFIVVEGPVGAGKTGLARRLAAHLHAEPVLEPLGTNPFLERLVEDPAGARFPTQLFFLLQRAKHYAALRQPDLFDETRISNFMIERDPLFARIFLDEAELDLYEQVYALLALDAPKPDLVIYLQASPQRLLDRIRARNRPHERPLDRERLRQVVDAYAGYFLDYQAAPLLIVNVERLDPAERDEDFRLLLPHILEPQGGRRFFNPEPMPW